MQYLHSSLYAALRKRPDLRKACACMPCASASARCPCSHTQDLPCLGHHRRACELCVSSVAAITRLASHAVVRVCVYLYREAFAKCTAARMLLAREHVLTAPFAPTRWPTPHAPSSSCHNHAVVAPRLRQPSQHRYSTARWHSLTALAGYSLALTYQSPWTMSTSLR